MSAPWGRLAYCDSPHIGTRKSLFVDDSSNGLGERGVVNVKESDRNECDTTAPALLFCQ